MRTTIDLPNEKRSRLMALAARRGLRGYSEIVAEAVERYLVEEEKRVQNTEKLLALRGFLNAAEADEAERRIKEVWANWRLS